MTSKKVSAGPGCVLLCLFFLNACSDRKSLSLKPDGLEGESVLTMEKGNLKAVFVDNSAFGPHHRAGYNGVAQLFHAQEDSGIFVPAYAGFNLEHIFDGDSLDQLFEPRNYPMTLYRKSEYEVLLYQEPTPLSGVESLTSFKMVEPHYIDVSFDVVFHRTDFFDHDYAGLFWASYINNPRDKKMYFKGMTESDIDSVYLVAAWSEEHGRSSTHRSADDDHDFYFADNFNARLANHYSGVRFAEPWFFGRYKNMVLAYFIKGEEVVRFSQSPTGGGRMNPAWDFQYLIPSPKENKKYSLKVRVMYKPFVSEQDVASEFAKWYR